MGATLYQHLGGYDVIAGINDDLFTVFVGILTFIASPPVGASIPTTARGNFW